MFIELMLIASERGERISLMRHRGTLNALPYHVSATPPLHPGFGIDKFELFFASFEEGKYKIAYVIEVITGNFSGCVAPLFTKDIC